MVRMRAMALVAPVLVGLAGCGDRLGQGDRVVLISDVGDNVRVSDMPDHTPADPSLAAYHANGGKIDNEAVSTGTRASVVADPGGDNRYRKVKVLLLDPPYQGITGTVSRDNLRRE